MANQIIEDIRAKIKSGNPVTRLIIINAAVFIIISVLRIILLLTGNWGTFAHFVDFVISNITLSLNPEGLYKPWTIITYMFTHIEIFHIFWNMITLFWFGQILLEYTSSKKIIPLYLLGGIAGAIFTWLIYISIPGLQAPGGNQLLGASAGVTAIIVAAATLIPEFRMNLLFVGPVKLIYVAIFVIFIDVLNIASYSNIGGNLAHIGGALMGYVFIVQYKKGRDMAKPFNRSFDWITGTFRRSGSPRMKVVHKKGVSDEEYNASKIVTQKQIDAILDKISKSGYESLTKTEKDILFKVSKK